MKVSEIMSKDIISVRPESKISEATRILLDNHINGLPVVNEQNELVGIICQSDIIYQQKNIPIPTVFTLLDGFFPLTSTQQLEKEVEKMSATTVEQAMSRNPVSVSPDSDLEELAELMVKKNYHTIPVTQDKKLVGIVGKEDVLKTLFK